MPAAKRKTPRQCRTPKSTKKCFHLLSGRSNREGPLTRYESYSSCSDIPTHAQWLTMRPGIDTETKGGRKRLLIRIFSCLSGESEARVNPRPSLSCITPAEPSRSYPRGIRFTRLSWHLLNNRSFTSVPREADHQIRNVDRIRSDISHALI